MTTVRDGNFNYHLKSPFEILLFLKYEVVYETPCPPWAVQDHTLFFWSLK